MKKWIKDTMNIKGGNREA